MKLAFSLLVAALTGTGMFACKKPDVVHEVEWTVYGQDLGSTLREVRWEMPQGSQKPKRVVSTQPLAFLGQAFFQEDYEGFSFRPADGSAPKVLRTEASGRLNVRSVFDWCGRGEPPAKVKAWVVASCHGSRKVATVSSVHLVDAATGKDPEPDPDSTLQKVDPNGPVFRNVLLEVRNGRAELRIAGTVKTGGVGKWSVFIGGSATPSPSYRMGQGPPLPKPPL
jgi:hypothetical protein